MKKIYMVFLLLIFILTSCSIKSNVKDSGDVSANNTYEVENITYSDNDISINYPKLSNFQNQIKQDKINELIKTEALKILESYNDEIKTLDLKMDYEIMYRSENFISIKYLGLVYVKGAAFPVNEFYTTNIDIEKEKLIYLTDMVTVNDKFIEIFNSGEYKAYSEDLNLESVGALKDALASFENDTLKQILDMQSAKFYFTENSIVVSIELPHVMGDHLEMEIKYSDLGELLLIKP